MSDVLSNSESPSTDVESLKKDEAKGPYTTLLVGEIGVGKSSVLELIVNVLHDVDHYDFHTLDQHQRARWF